MDSAAGASIRVAHLSLPDARAKGARPDYGWIFARCALPPLPMCLILSASPLASSFLPPLFCLIVSVVTLQRDVGEELASQGCQPKPLATPTEGVQADGRGASSWRGARLLPLSPVRRRSEVLAHGPSGARCATLHVLRFRPHWQSHDAGRR